MLGTDIVLSIKTQIVQIEDYSNNKDFMKNLNDEKKCGIFHPISLYSPGKRFTEILIYMHFKDKMGLDKYNFINQSTFLGKI